MADKEIPNLTGAGDLTATDTVHIVQGGNSRKVAIPDRLLTGDVAPAVAWTAAKRALAFKTLAQAKVSFASSDTLVANHRRARVSLAGTGGTLSITAVATLGDGFECLLTHDGSGDWVLDPNGSEQVDGAATATMKPGDKWTLYCDGAALVTLRSANGANLYDRALSLSAAQQAQGRANMSAALKGSIFGLTLSNNVSDPTNDIDIAAGETASTETNSVLMVLASALTKRLDAAWVVGTNQGGLDTGSIADTTYHVWVIQRSDTGIVDALFSTSATAPTMPANYDRKRRIGSIVRISSAIKPFLQYGADFYWVTPTGDVNTVNPGTSAVTRTITVPTGIPLLARVWAVGSGGSGTTASDNSIAIYLSDLAAADVTASSASAASQSAYSGNGIVLNGGYVEVRTSTLGQIRSRLQQSSANTTLFIGTIGWMDRRGKDA